MGLFGFHKGKADNEKSEGIREAEPPVSEKMMWICEKCGFKVSGKEDESLARKIQKAVKSLASEDKRKREVSAHVSSCMNICPERKIAASIADLRSGTVRFIEFEYKGDIEKTAEQLYKLL